MKPSELVINFHVSCEQLPRLLACIRLLNMYCHRRQLEIVTVSNQYRYGLVACRLELITHEVHQLADLMAGLYFITGRTDSTLQDVSIVHH